MKEELKEKLEKAGFVRDDSSSDLLLDLIKSCGDNLEALFHFKDGWVATCGKVKNFELFGEPDEAIAELWIEINKKHEKEEEPQGI